MSYIYQTKNPLTEDKLKELKAKLRCEIKYDEKEAYDGFHYYVIESKVLSLHELHWVEKNYGLEMVIGMIGESEPFAKP